MNKSSRLLYLFTIPRSLVVPLLLVFYTFLVSAWFVFVSLLVHNRRYETQIIRNWGKGMVWLSGIRLKVKGLENIPDEGVLFIFNHQSHLDIPIIHAAIPKDCRFGAKIELFRIPIFSWAMRRAGALPIPRAKRNQAVRVLEEAENRIKSGESFVLAPEGTRQSEPTIGSFRSGPFVVAIKAQAPLVPVIIRGAHRVLPKGSIFLNWRSFYNPVEVEILDSVSTQGYDYDQREKLKAMVRERMVIAFEKSPPLPG